MFRTIKSWNELSRETGNLKTLNELKDEHFKIIYYNANQQYVAAHNPWYERKKFIGLKIDKLLASKFEHTFRLKLEWSFRFYENKILKCKRNLVR